MTRLTYEQLIVANLGQGLSEHTRGYMPKEQASELLKQYAGQDFGYDVKAWKKWMRDERKNGRDPLRHLNLKNS